MEIKYEFPWSWNESLYENRKGIVAANVFWRFRLETAKKYLQLQMTVHTFVIMNSFGNGETGHRGCFCKDICFRKNTTLVNMASFRRGV